MKAESGRWKSCASNALSAATWFDDAVGDKAGAAAADAASDALVAEMKARGLT